MSSPLKKSIKNNGMIKGNKKVKKIGNKSGRVLLRVFCVIVRGFFRVIVSVFYWHCCKLNDNTRVPIPCTNMNSSVHSQFSVLVKMIFMTKILYTVDSCV